MGRDFVDACGEQIEAPTDFGVMVRGSAIAVAFMIVMPASAQVPLPPPRPTGIENELPSSGPSVPARFPSSTGALPSGEAGSDADAASCAARLAALGIKAEQLPEIRSGACGTKHPVRLLQLANRIDVLPPALVTCAAAEAFARWVQEGVTVAAERHFAAPPRKVLIGTSYECRAQNRQPGAKLSEHAFANALDVMGFEFDNRRPLPIASRPDESPESMFLATVRAKACEHFTTVLGPGSDAAHANHLHLDLRERKRGAKLCQ
jgi:hypothetical protein